MRNWPKAVVVTTLLVLVAVFGLGACCPDLFGTRISYFDTRNGRVRIQLASFGHVYQETVNETEYSRLLKELGFPETQPDWKFANREELGIRRWFLPQHPSSPYGRIAADARLFAMTVKVNETDPTTAREKTDQIRKLILAGDQWKIKDLVVALQKAQK